MTVLNAFFTSFPSVDSSPLCWSVCHRPPQGISYYPPFPCIYTILEKPLIDFYLVFGKPVSSQIPFRIIHYNEITFIISYALSQED